MRHKLIEITPEEYEALRLAGVWVQWTPYEKMRPKHWWGSASNVSAMDLRNCGCFFYTRVDDERDDNQPE